MAGVNRGTIYHNFQSRSRLVAAAAERRTRQLTQAVFGDLADPGRQSDEPAKVVPVVGRLVDFAMRNPALSQAWLFQVLTIPDPSKDAFWREYSSRSERFHDTPMSADNIDSEASSVIVLAGSLLRPIRTHAKYDAAADHSASSIGSATKWQDSHPTER